MKKRIYFFAAFLITMLTTTNSYAQANQTLSNLTSPTAANISISPGITNSIDLGASGKRWRNLYLGNSIYLKGALTMHSPLSNTNFFIGPYSGNSTLSGYYNNAFGSSALANLSSGSGNTAGGYAAGYSTNTGSSNTALGYFSLYQNLTGHSNVSVGAGALKKNTAVSNQVAVGDSALFNFNAGTYGWNTAVGSKALYSDILAYGNTAVGYNALYANTGYLNNAIGHLALNSNTSGEQNSALGAYTMLANTIGSRNTALGNFSLWFNTSGSYNIAVGSSLTNNTTGSNNTAIGYNAGVAVVSFSNSTSIGNDATADGSNKVRIGNTAIISIGGQVGWTIFSDGRYKKNIKENVPGLKFINGLKPITYTVDVEGLNHYYHADKPALSENPDANIVIDKKENAALQQSYEVAAKVNYSGFIAQDVEKAAYSVGFDFSGVDKPQAKDGLYGLRYDNFVVPLVKAVQELSNLNDEKDARLNTQQTQIDALQKQIDDLKALINSGSQTNTSSAKTTAQLSSATLQNVPNPFSGTTIINYTLPAKFATAQIIITDKTGKQVKQYILTASGTVSFDAASLAAGTYSYSLIVDGALQNTKQMVVVK